jgi:hypothetical protein
VEPELTGVVKMAGDASPGIRVEIHLDREELSLVSAVGALGTWPLDGVGISARVDGFHLRIEGEELILSTSDDARFALAMGLRSTSSPRLNRQLAAAMDGTFDAGVALAAPPQEFLEDVARRFRTDSSPVAMGIIGAATTVFIGALVAVSTGSDLRLFGLTPAWPFMVLAALALAGGGLSLLSRLRGARSLVMAGLVLGLFAIAGAIPRLGGPSFSWIGDGVLLTGVGTVLAALLLSVDKLNRS